MPLAKDRVCVITGATSGIGLETALELAGRGWQVALVGRDRQRGAEALAAVKAAGPLASPSVHYADLSSPRDVERLAGELLGALPRIDVLINNAGSFFLRRQLTADGLERTFALNHMAYFVLTACLLTRLTECAPSRIVNVASDAHRGAQLDFADLQMKRGYGGWRAYRASKLCNILHARQLAKRLAGSGVTANSLHPGLVASRFGDSMGGVAGVGWRATKRLLGISAKEGAATPVFLATSDTVADVSGAYFYECQPAPPSVDAEDDASAERLWQESMRIWREVAPPA